MADHARFAPSSAHRWVVCQQSLLPLPEGYHYVKDEEESANARLGTAKHKLSEWAIANDCDTTDALLECMEFAGLPVTVEMCEAADVYVNAVRELQSRDPSYNYRELECSLEMYNIHEDMEGTADCLLYSEAKRHVIVVDAKFGWKVVEAEGNWQLRSYAIGAVNYLEDLGLPVEKITTAIVQPTDSYAPVKVCDYERRELDGFARALKKATKGNAVQAGLHCEYCPRAAICEALASFSNEVLPGYLHGPEDFDGMVAQLTPEKIAEILDRQEVVKIWFAAVANYAKTLLMLKADVPGYELEETKGNRKYRDADRAERVLLQEFGDGIYEPRQLRSPAQIEAIWPRAKVLMNGRPGETGLTERPMTGLKLKRKQDG